MNTNLVIMPCLLTIGGGKDPGYQSGQIPLGFNESYQHSAHIGHCQGLGPCGGRMDGDGGCSH